MILDRIGDFVVDNFTDAPGWVWVCENTSQERASTSIFLHNEKICVDNGFYCTHLSGYWSVKIQAKIGQALLFFCTVRRFVWMIDFTDAPESVWVCEM